MSNDFIDLGIFEELAAYQAMDDERIKKLLKGRYTNNLIAMAVARKDELDGLKGRMLEDLALLNGIATYKEKYLKINEQAKAREQRKQILNKIRDKLLCQKH